MDMNQFTQKTVAALQRAQSLAIEYQHMQVEQEHLLLTWVKTKDARIQKTIPPKMISIQKYSDQNKSRNNKSTQTPTSER